MPSVGGSQHIDSWFAICQYTRGEEEEEEGDDKNEEEEEEEKDNDEEEEGCFHACNFKLLHLGRATRWALENHTHRRQRGRLSQFRRKTT